MKTFTTSLDLGNEGEKHFENWLEVNPHVEGYKKMHHFLDFKGKPFEYDYLVRKTSSFQSVSFEVKTLEGASPSGSEYSTAVIEVFCDMNKSKRPGWYRATSFHHLNYICFINRHRSSMYFFNAQRLKSFVDEIPEQSYRKANDGNRDANGLIVLIPWRSERAGFIFEEKICKNLTSYPRLKKIR